MNNEIIIALISALAVAIPTVFINRSNLIKHNTEVDMKIEHLTEEVKKHNSIVERTYKLESNVDLLDEKIKVANNRLKSLESRGNN